MIEIIEDRANLEFYLKIFDLKETFKDSVRKGWHETGVEVRREVRRILRTGSRSGRVYNYEGSRIRASAPGEAPAKRSGRLAKSVNYKVRSWAEMIIGESAPYARAQELGTRTIKARPHLIKAINNKEKDIEKIMLHYLDRGYKK